MPFTPGPWTADLERNFILGGDTIEIEALNPDGTVNREVASCMLSTDGHPSTDPTEDEAAEWQEDCANVRLICAAPSLLAACREYIAYREGNDGNVDEIADRMKAAIRLAEISADCS